MISNYEIFQETYKFIKDSESEKEVLKEFGGSSIYIPSFKSIYRNEEIREKYTHMRNEGKTGIVKKLAYEYNLTESQIFRLTKMIRDK